jgi:hypothetical protein
VVFEADFSWYMDGTYVSFIHISYDALLEEYLLDVLVHAFDMWLSYILRHVVDDLMRWLCCTSLMIHSLIYSSYVIDTYLVHC